MILQVMQKRVIHDRGKSLKFLNTSVMRIIMFSKGNYMTIKNKAIISWQKYFIQLPVQYDDE